MADTIVDDLLDMAADVVTIEPMLSTDKYGEFTYGPPVDWPARVIGRTRKAMDTDGNERVSNVQAVFLALPNSRPEDRFTLPERFTLDPNETDPVKQLINRQPKAIAVDKESDENGAHHETVYFSNARLRSF